MFRLYDLMCGGCELPHEEVVSFPQGEDAPRWIEAECPHCGDVSRHRRMLSKPAKLLSDRPFSPQMMGGKYDTMGYKRQTVPRPEMPSNPTANDLRDRYHSKEWKEYKAEKLNLRNENQAKRARAKLIQQGATIDMRHHRLPGDPDLMT